jgi:PAS domain S-box-containing protein
MDTKTNATGEAALPPESAPRSLNPMTASGEQEFLEWKEAYQQILDAIDDMVLVKGENSRIVWANRSFCDYYGMTNEQLRRIIDAPFNPQTNTEQYLLDDRFVYTTGQRLDIKAEIVTRHDGVMRLFNTVKTPLRDSQGRVWLTVGVSRDITEQKKSEEELARHREHLEQLVAERTREVQALMQHQRVIIRSLVEAIIAVDAAHRVTLMNPAAEMFTGWPQPEASGRDLGQVVQIAEEKTRQALPETAFLNPQDLPSPPFPAWLKSRTGEERLVAISTSRMVGAAAGNNGWVLILRDISLERKIEDQNVRSQKLESLGLLAGGIAHDFNNLLTAVLGNVSIALHDLPADSELAGVLQSAAGACRRARQLATQLLTFSRGGAPVKKVQPAAPTVREAAELALRGAPVVLEMRVAEPLDLVEVDEGQLSQAVNNLVLNARQAMPDGGRVNIALDNATLAPADRLPLPPGRYVRIAVHGNGVGIAPDHLPKVFDPYFTTKQSGSGLGLASVHSIITRHGGYVSVESEPGRGTRFAIYLPASSQPTPAEPPPLPPPDTNGRLKLLVLDDDSSVRKVIGLMFARLQHQAKVVGTSREALAEFSAARETGQPFDLVLVDLTLPGDLSGEEVIARLRALDPAVQIVIMSGYSASTLLADHEQLGLVGALPKPFDRESLREVLAKAQDRILRARQNQPAG